MQLKSVSFLLRESLQIYRGSNKANVAFFKLLCNFCLPSMQRCIVVKSPLYYLAYLLDHQVYHFRFLLVVLLMKFCNFSNLTSLNRCT